jgi:2-phosphosulfolactate phosphatase
VKLDVVFAPAEIEAAKLAGRTIVVIDVLRATSTIIEALSNGARAVIPVDTVERAVRTAAEIGRDEVLLCGERGAKPIAGFQLGNSPLEFTAERVAGKTLVMTTTNGTQAMLAAGAARRCMIGAFLNADAVTAALAGDDDVVLLCAGREGRFALDDAVCAGWIARRLAQRGSVRRTDGTRAAIRLASHLGKPPLRFLRRTAHGAHLRRLGLGRDVDFCGEVDRWQSVPQLRDRRAVL